MGDMVKQFWIWVVQNVGWNFGVQLKEYTVTLAGIIIGGLLATLFWTKALTNLDVDKRLDGTNIAAMRVQHDGKSQIKVQNPKGFMHTYWIMISILIVKTFKNVTVRFESLRKIRILVIAVMIALVILSVFGILSGRTILSNDSSLWHQHHKDKPPDLPD